MDKVTKWNQIKQYMTNEPVSRLRANAQCTRCLLKKVSEICPRASKTNAWWVTDGSTPADSRQKTTHATTIFMDAVSLINKQPLVPSRTPSPFFKFTVFGQCHVRLFLVHNYCSVVRQIRHTASEWYNSCDHHQLILHTVNKSAKKITT